MLEIGIKAPAFSLPDQNGDMHTWRTIKVKRSFCISIRKTARRDVQNRHAALRSCIPNLRKKMR